MLGLVFEKADLQCGQESSTADLRGDLARRFPTLVPGATVPVATARGSKGSLGRAERAHLAIQGQPRTYRQALNEAYNTTLILTRL